MFKSGVKVLISVIAVIFSAMSVYAGTLSEIEITQDNNGKYNVVFGLDEEIKVVKETSSKGNLSLLLKSTNLSENLNISYENSTDLQNIVVQRKNKDNAVVLLEGKNIENAKILNKNITNGEITEVKIKNNTLLYSSLSIFGLFLLLAIRNTLIMMKRRRKKATQDPNELIKKKIQEVNTLRKKNKQQSKNIPSINYNINNSRTTIPEGFIINNYKNNQRSRKVG